MSDTSAMTPALQQRLNTMNIPALCKLLRDSERALAKAEPHRATNLRARIVSEANEAMMANVGEVLAAREPR
jgi:hypothetical protein